MTYTPQYVGDSCLAETVLQVQESAHFVFILSKGQLGFITTDNFGPVPKVRSNSQFIVVMIDGFSKHTKAIPVTKKKVATSEKAFTNDSVSSFGVPCKVLTDNKPRFPF